MTSVVDAKAGNLIENLATLASLGARFERLQKMQPRCKKPSALPAPSERSDDRFPCNHGVLAPRAAWRSAVVPRHEALPNDATARPRGTVGGGGRHCCAGPSTLRQGFGGLAVARARRRLGLTCWRVPGAAADCG